MILHSSVAVQEDQWGEEWMSDLQFWDELLTSENANYQNLGTSFDFSNGKKLAYSIWAETIAFSRPQASTDGDFWNVEIKKRIKGKEKNTEGSVTSIELFYQLHPTLDQVYYHLEWNTIVGNNASFKGVVTKEEFTKIFWMEAITHEKTAIKKKPILAVITWGLSIATWSIVSMFSEQIGRLSATWK